ncbi:hypothetical protein [Cognatishimia sp. F0-27]|uniref:hypothetical protein n=1 Tax=Cognatishimia sp. F0-27 TaxID=2816855 RepID=UPI001D0CC90E|nr:hypothetical protein [Cognatishimia sp. F0-27]MCC1493882.1 hypothetical protein [Cognatishimia sp. F0-27]
MSAPDVNIEKQKRRHKGPLAGIAIVVLAVGAFVIFSSQAPENDLPETAAGAADQS